MRRIAFGLMAAASAAVLVACSSSSGGSTTAGSTGSTSAPAPSVSSSSSSPPSPSSSDTGVATALDPCQLVTAGEASKLAGVTFGSGEEKKNGNGKECIYGAQTRNVFTVELGQASSPAIAKSEWSQAQAQAKALVAGKLPPGVHVTLDTKDVSGVGDRASTVYGSATIAGAAVGFSGIYALKGATFFAFQDLTVGQGPPSVASMKSQAETTAIRVS